MLFINTETARINRLIEEGAETAMTEQEFFAREIEAWKGSKERMEQIRGDNYYDGQQDILERKRMVIGEDGKLKEVENLPNNKIVDNQYSEMVDQKTNYLLGKPFTINCENKKYLELLKKRFKKSFYRLLKYICEDAFNGGVSWMFVYYDDKGEMCYRRFPAFQILPFWADDDHTVLDAAVRLYVQEVWEGTVKKYVERVELFKPDGIYRYIFEGSTLIPDVEIGEYSPYFTVKTEEKTEGYNWDRLPLIAFKYNKREIPLIRRVKSLQDGINAIQSDFLNNMQEDARNTILILKNYDGENLGEFRRNLSTYGSVKVRDDGGVETLTIEVNADNYKAILEIFKKALIKNARGYDASELRTGGTPNQMNIKSVLSDLDLDANQTETEFQAAMEQLLWFINQDLKTKGMGDFENEEVTIVFNRDTIISETEVITGIQNSVGILSNETLIEQHPWTQDPKVELERLKKEKDEAASEYMSAFPRQNKSNDEPGEDE